MIALEKLILALYFLALCVMFVFGINNLMLSLLYRRSQKRAQAEKLGESGLKRYPRVTIQLPVYNEVYVVERLIRAACQIDYPRDKLEIQVLDDSTDETLQKSRRCVEEYQKLGYNIQLLHREKRVGYKSGALREGLKKATGEFIAIFDADFVPPRDFLRQTLPYFEDPRVGMVQTRWAHLNLDYSLLTKVQAMGLDGHFVVEQTARNYAGFFINFNGTGGIWRKSCILDAGNWQDDTLTEDLDLSYRAQLRGWKFIFLKNVVCPAELPSEMGALKAQQFRWTKGAMETAKKILPQVWKAKISPWVKLQATVHLTNNFVFPMVLICALLNLPLVQLKHGHNDYGTYFTIATVFILAFLGTFIFYFHSQKNIYPNWRKRILYFPIFLGGTMGLSISNTKAILEGLLNKRSEFIRTPKYLITKKRDKWKNKKYHHRNLDPVVYLEIFMAFYTALPLFYAIRYLEIGAIPFLALFCFGYGFVAYMSIKHYIEFRLSQSLPRRVMRLEGRAA